MKVQVSFGSGSLYTYEIDADVAEGDTVMVPAPFWNTSGPARQATVVATTSDYQGPCSRAWLPPRDVSRETGAAVSHVSRETQEGDQQGGGTG